MDSTEVLKAKVACLQAATQVSGQINQIVENTETLLKLLGLAGL